MKRALPKLKRVVVKIGSSSLCHSNGEIDPKRIETVVNEIASILKKIYRLSLFPAAQLLLGTIYLIQMVIQLKINKLQLL